MKSGVDDKDAEIGVCILSAVNLLEVKEGELGGVCDIIVRLLDELIDFQDYPVAAAENFCKNIFSVVAHRLGPLVDLLFFTRLHLS